MNSTLKSPRLCLILVGLWILFSASVCGAAGEADRGNPPVRQSLPKEAGVHDFNQPEPDDDLDATRIGIRMAAIYANCKS